MSIQRINRGQIFWCKRLSAGNSVDTLELKTRPLLIISNNERNKYSSKVLGIYSSTSDKKSDLPYHVKVRLDGKNTTFVCEKIYQIDVNRLSDYIGTADDETMAEVDKAILYATGVIDLPNDVEKRKRTYEDIKSRVRERNNLVVINDDEIEKMINFCNFREKYGVVETRKEYHMSLSLVRETYLIYCERLHKTPIKRIKPLMT